MGLPTMVRPVKQYVKKTLDSLLRHLHSANWNFTVILLLLADQNPRLWNTISCTCFGISERQIMAGLVEILVPNRDFYATLAS